jgi:hypothetical protein
MGLISSLNNRLSAVAVHDKNDPEVVPPQARAISIYYNKERRQLKTFLTQIGSTHHMFLVVDSVEEL